MWYYFSITCSIISRRLVRLLSIPNFTSHPLYFGYIHHIYRKSGEGKIRDHCLFRDPKAHYFICSSVQSSFVYFHQSDVIQKIPAIGCRYLIWTLCRIYNLRLNPPYLKWMYSKFNRTNKSIFHEVLLSYLSTYRFFVLYLIPNISVSYV